MSKELIKKLPPLEGDKYRILSASNAFKMCGNPFRIDTYKKLINDKIFNIINKE